MPDVPILPPGPSEEFLRRQEMMSVPRNIATAGSFDPSTGERQGMALSYNPVPPATSEMQMMEAIRQQVNALHFKNAQDALNASIQFQHMREAQRMRESGASDEQIWSRLGRGLVYANPNVLPQMVNQVRPVPEATVTDIGGVKVLRSGLRGERAQAVPQSALAQTPFEPRTKIVDGEKVVQLGPNRWQLINGDEPSASVLRTIYKDEISDLKEELETLPNNKKPETVAARTALEKQIGEFRVKRKALSERTSHAAPAAPAVSTQSAAPGYTVGKIYKGGLKYLGGDIKDQKNWEKVQ